MQFRGKLLVSVCDRRRLTSCLYFANGEILPLGDCFDRPKAAFKSPVVLRKLLGIICGSTFIHVPVVSTLDRKGKSEVAGLGAPPFCVSALGSVLL